MTTTSILDAAPLNKSEKQKRAPVATRCKIESIFSDTLKRSAEDFLHVLARFHSFYHGLEGTN